MAPTPPSPGRQLAQAAAEMMTPRDQIVFERLRENSDIVLIDLPQMTPDRWENQIFRLNVMRTVGQSYVWLFCAIA